MRPLGLCSLALALTLAAPVAAQTGPLAPPPPPAVSQSEPGHGPLQERYTQLLQRQRAFEQARAAHNGRCLGIPKTDQARVAACQQSKQNLDRERDAYGTALREYEANQAFWQGRTLYLRGDYDGAMDRYYHALSLAPYRSAFEGDPIDEIDLARAAKAADADDLETANMILCQIDDRQKARPSWLETEMRTLFNKFFVKLKKRLNRKLVPRGGGTCAVRG